VIYSANNRLGRLDFALGSRGRMLIVGDSHQADLFNALNENRDRFD